LTTIDIPDGVTSIGNDTFSRCSSLTTIDIPASVTSIGNRTFQYCFSLATIDIPANVTSIGNEAFYFCKALTSVIIGTGVTSIGYTAFYGCSSLTDLYCYATTPPKLDRSDGNYNFPNYGENTTLHVPARCGTKYKSSNWNIYFKSIKEMD